MYALVDILGKQYKVEQGSVLKVDHVVQDKGSAIEFPSVLMVSDGEKTQVGNPYLAGVTVRAVVEDHGRDRKLVFGKYKKKKNYRRRYGHRRQYSLIKVEGFNGVEGSVQAVPAAKENARGTAPAKENARGTAPAKENARGTAPKEAAQSAAPKGPARPRAAKKENARGTAQK